MTRSSPRCSFARPTTPCVAAIPSGPTSTTCAFSTWRRMGVRRRLKLRWRCSWRSARPPPMRPCAHLCFRVSAQRCQNCRRGWWICRCMTSYWSKGGAMSSLFTELTSQLHALKLPTMAESFSEIALKAVRNGLSHEAYLHELVRLEGEAREQRRRARLLQESGLPREKTFRTLQLGAFPPLVRQQVERLRSGAFVQHAVNVVVVGKPGAGKSHLLASLGHALVEQGYPVLWRSTAQLMQQIGRA